LFKFDPGEIVYYYDPAARLTEVDDFNSNIGHYYFSYDALIGALYPLVLTIFGWGPSENFLSELPISIGAGAVCGFALAREAKKQVSPRC